MKSFGACPEYRYLPLPENTLLAYRTFTLYPAFDPSATIRGRMQICSLSCTEQQGVSWDKFEALSYVWGDTTFTAMIDLDGYHLPISANLESFLRHRREHDQPVTLWIDTICINQGDTRERSSQVQAMGKIYILTNRLSIWLGPPCEHSVLATNTLREIGYETAFAKLSSSPEQCSAIEHLFNRAWWFRTWIIQEIALGALGNKYQRVTVHCGRERLSWSQLVLACARIHVNALNMRQNFPAVRQVLKLDTLASRHAEELDGAGELYSRRLLRQLSEHRNCSVLDPRDKIYAMRGLWIDAFDVGKPSDARASDIKHKRALTVNYDHGIEKAYLDFASWVLNDTQTLELLRYCQLTFIDSAEFRASLPSWVPDWSQALVQARLPFTRRTEDVYIPWWSLPFRDNNDGSQTPKYLLDNQSSRRKRAEKIVHPVPPNTHYIPEWVVDIMDPDGSKGYESLFKELQNRSDVLFIFGDESDRGLGRDAEDVWTALSRTQDHNEKSIQIQLLSQYISSNLWVPTQYKACGDLVGKPTIKDRTLQVKGILCDPIGEVYDIFPEDVEKNWLNSTLLMVQIGRCKFGAMKEGLVPDPYLSEQASLVAFWKTLFAGQQAKDENKITSLLPHVLGEWRWEAPSLTVLDSGRLEYAEIRSIVAKCSEHLASTTTGVKLQTLAGFDEYLANDDTLLDARWSPSDRLKYRRLFEHLGKHWATQPYDLYHRPSNLPHVVPDSYWKSRCLHDNTALKVSSEERHRTIIESFNAPTREVRREARRFLTARVRQQPARQPQGLDDVHLINFALGRRFFVSENGYFGLAPPAARKGDRIAVLLGAQAPIIVRESSTTFKVVGESYIHRLMNGEAIDQWRLGAQKIQDIVLV